jgi:hypothetical protein
MLLVAFGLVAIGFLLSGTKNSQGTPKGVVGSASRLSRILAAFLDFFP